jgi:hypothetical protein
MEKSPSRSFLGVFFYLIGTIFVLGVAIMMTAVEADFLKSLGLQEFWIF